ncbi:MAG: DUF4338 domain-containing protein [Thermoanaerobaculia bacterium]|nr:DUF4338 domain-containing protein [Thermoanaerobaculia bacterium]
MTLRGRQFSEKDLVLIKTLVTEFYKEGRTRASEEICLALDWRQENGWLKDRACRDVLLRLEARGFLELPPRKASPAGNRTRKGQKIDTASLDVDDQPREVSIRKLQVRQVKGTSGEAMWNELVARHHYLGFNVAVGRSLKYLVEDEIGPVAAVGFSDPAWAVQARDHIMQSLGWPRTAARKYGVSNSRFVVFPWARIPNLASAALSRVVRRLPHDWQEYYAIKPWFLETFVDSSRFLGTCYRAANWKEVGSTRGFMKVGSSHQNGQTEKMLFLFPLETSLREKLRNL